MNSDQFEGRWKQVRGRAKEWWGKLTDDDLDQIDGKFDRFVGLLQEKYGYAKEKAKEELQRRMDALTQESKVSTVGGPACSSADRPADGTHGKKVERGEGGRSC